jgi:hypothetical protein
MQRVFIRPGAYYASVRTWAIRTIRPSYLDAPVVAAPSRLVLTVAPSLFSPEPAPAPRAGDVARLGTRAGKRIVKRIREALEDALEGLDPGDVELPDAEQEWEWPSGEDALVVEACGEAVAWAGPALGNGALDEAELDDLVARTKDMGFSYAWDNPTRTAFAEAAYLGLASAELAETLLPYANHPGRFPFVFDPADELVGRACRRALQETGLTGVKVRTDTGAASLAFTVPSTQSLVFSAPRAAAARMRCRSLPGRPWSVTPLRCTWAASRHLTTAALAGTTTGST